MKLYQPQPHSRKTAVRLLTELSILALFVLCFAAFVMIVVPMQAEKENQWRAERLCRIYSLCHQPADTATQQGENHV